MFTVGQIIDAIIFFCGVGVLTWCAKVERKQMEKMRDPREKWAYIDGDKDKEKELKFRSLRSIALTVLGVALALYGFFDFLSQI